MLNKNFNIKKIFFVGISAIFAMIFSCSSDGGKPEPTDTPTSGEVNVVVDESFQKLFDYQIFTFEAI